MPLQPGVILNGQYYVLRLLGRGGFGYVYLAQDKVLGEQVAIKELIPALAGDEDGIKRFLMEARATMRLTHERIIRTHSIFVEGGNHYIVMEYAPGGSLQDRLKERRGLPVEEAVGVAADLCEGLSYAHARGVVHCDLKPGNILFGADGRPKIADFGIAHVPGQMFTRTWNTPGGFVSGTLPYMSPEQAAGVRDDPRLDIYAVGAILYCMLTGHTYLEFEQSDTPAAQAANVGRIQAAAPLPPSVHDRRVPAWVDAAVLKALAKDPAARFAATSEMRVVLERRGATTGGTPAGAGTERAANATQPRAGLDKIVPHNQVATLPAERAEARTAPGKDPTSRRVARRQRTWLWLLLSALAAAALAGVLAWLPSRGPAQSRSPGERDASAQISSLSTLSPAPPPTGTALPLASSTRPSTAAFGGNAGPAMTGVAATQATPTPRPTATPAPTTQPPPTATAERFVAVSLSAIANAAITDGYVNSPLGDVTFSGVRFSLGKGQSVTTQARPLPDNPRSISLQVDVLAPEAVYLLITGGDVFNRFAGQTIGRVRLVFSDGNTHAVDLVAGQNLREWKQSGDVIGRAASPQLTEVWRGANRFDASPAVIDMLKIAVPPELQSGRLVRVEVIDLSAETVGDLDPALNVLGVSVALKPAPTATPTPQACRIAAGETFRVLWGQQRPQLGCALNQAAQSDATTERFQRGRMIWRKNNDMIYVLDDDGDWAAYPDISVDGAPEPEGFQPPVGLYTPVRGFGAIWRARLGGTSARIGWATQDEYAVSAQFQDFEKGLMLEMEGKVYLLGEDGGRWLAP